MTPKEKAKELIDRFNEYTVVSSIHYPSGKIMEDLTNAKQCALIAVNELIKSVSDVNSWYWEEVKEEIEKL